MSTLSHLQIRNPKDDETPIEAASQIFSSILSNDHIGFWDQLFKNPPTVSFELFLLNQTLYFYSTVPKTMDSFVASMMASTYPSCAINRTTDPIDILLKSKHISIGEVTLANSYYYPFKTYTDFANVPALSPLARTLTLSVVPAVRPVTATLLTTPTRFQETPLSKLYS